MEDMKIEQQARDTLVEKLQSQLQQMKLDQQEHNEKLDEVMQEKEYLLVSKNLQEQEKEKLRCEVASKEEEKTTIEMERRAHIKKLICEFQFKSIDNFRFIVN